MCTEVTIKCPTWRHSQSHSWQTVTGADLVATITGTTYVVLTLTADEVATGTTILKLDDLRRIVQVADALGVG